MPRAAGRAPRSWPENPGPAMGSPLHPSTRAWTRGAGFLSAAWGVQGPSGRWLSADPRTQAQVPTAGLSQTAQPAEQLCPPLSLFHCSEGLEASKLNSPRSPPPGPREGLHIKSLCGFLSITQAQWRVPGRGSRSLSQHGPRVPGLRTGPHFCPTVGPSRFLSFPSLLNVQPHLLCIRTLQGVRLSPCLGGMYTSPPAPHWRQSSGNSNKADQ